MSRHRETARLRIVHLITGLLVLAPQLAEACSVCGAGREEENRLAFIITTAFMSILPLLLIGGLVFWLRSRFRAMEAQQSALPANRAVVGRI